MDQSRSEDAPEGRKHLKIDRPFPRFMPLAPAPPAVNCVALLEQQAEGAFVSSVQQHIRMRGALDPGLIDSIVKAFVMMLNRERIEFAPQSEKLGIEICG